MTATLTRPVSTRRSPVRSPGVTALETTTELDVLCREPVRPARHTERRTYRRPARTGPARSAPAAPRRIAGTPCVGDTRDTSVYACRRAWAAAVLVGAGLAAIATIMTIAGNNYAASVTPEPISTEVVHVRAGESLSAVASRVAPDMPTDVVVRTIMDLNDLDSVTLQTGQPLLAPEYR